jgi:hypothetical protein
VEVAGVGRDTRRVGVRIDGADLHVDLALVHLRRVDGLVLHDHHILRVAAHAALVLLLLCAVRCKGHVSTPEGVSFQNRPESIVVP